MALEDDSPFPLTARTKHIKFSPRNDNNSRQLSRNSCTAPGSPFAADDTLMMASTFQDGFRRSMQQPQTIPTIKAQLKSNLNKKYYGSRMTGSVKITTLL